MIITLAHFDLLLSTLQSSLLVSDTAKVFHYSVETREACLRDLYRIMGQIAVEVKP